jgi:chemotaxis protein CheY-P-specific phosphatase CheC
MIGSELNLTEKQVISFDKFLADGTERALSALDNMFGLDIDSSDSSIEITPAVNSENLKHLGNGTLYTVSSAMVGELQGKILVLMRACDFKYLSKAMKPVLSLLFWTGTDDDLTIMDSLEQDWMEDDETEESEDEEFQKQMMDTLGEMANIFIGLYAKAIYKICHMSTHYSVPFAMKDTNQQIVQQVLWSPEVSDQLHLVIQNEFFVMDKPIRLWCLISPTQKSFRDILERIEHQEEYH